MSEKWNAFLQKLKRPPAWLTTLTFAVCILSTAGSLCTLLIKADNFAWEIVSYCLYAIAAISLSYAVYILVRFAPKMKKTAVERLENYKFTRSLMGDYGFRTVIFAIGLNLLGACGKKIRVGNFLPAIFMPLLYLPVRDLLLSLVG